MPDPNLGLFREWRVADRQAHVLEQALSKASLAALDGRGDPPTREDRQKAHSMRKVADDLFTASYCRCRTPAEMSRALLYFFGAAVTRKHQQRAPAVDGSSPIKGVLALTPEAAGP